MASSKKSSFLAQHWFLLTLVTVLPIGVLFAERLKWLNGFPLARTLLVCVVMGLMALPIPFGLIRQSLLRPWPAILASLVNMAVVPVLCWLAAFLLSPYLGGGLIVAAAIPCTLASAAVWTRRAGGDDTVAILVTLITNTLCVVITPVWLVLLLGRSVQLDLSALVQELLIIVLLPLIVAQLMRANKHVAQWAEHRKRTLGTTCQIGILIMVLSSAIQMGLHMQADQPVVDTTSVAPPVTAPHMNAPQVTVIEIGLTIALAATVHLLAMAIGWFLAGATGVARPQQIGVAISGSQKTLMIGLKMALDCGVSIIPMVAFHVGQLLLDTFIADRIRKADETHHVAVSLRDTESPRH